jgi:hypothetical protein
MKDHFVREKQNYTTAVRRYQTALLSICLGSLLAMPGARSLAADKPGQDAEASVSSTKPLSSANASQIVFSPGVIALNNPDGDRRGAASSGTPVTVNMTVYNSAGQVYGLHRGHHRKEYQFGRQRTQAAISPCASVRCGTLHRPILKNSTLIIIATPRWY